MRVTKPGDGCACAGVRSPVASRTTRIPYSRHQPPTWTSSRTRGCQRLLAEPPTSERQACRTGAQALTDRSELVRTVAEGLPLGVGLEDEASGAQGLHGDPEMMG